MFKSLDLSASERAMQVVFVIAARGWSQYNVWFGSFEVFQKAGRLGGEMIRVLMESEGGEEGDAAAVRH